MILDWVVERRHELAEGWTFHAWNANAALVVTDPAPFDVPSSVVHAWRHSTLARLRMAAAEGRPVSNAPITLRRLDAPPPMPAGRKATLVAKGMTLLDHCLAEASSVCVIGFLEHELAKGPDSPDMALTFIGRIAERCLEASLAGDATADLAIAILDASIGLMHGMSVDETDRWRAALERFTRRA